ncbi:MAG: glycosyltransferase family 2 protein [Candidatus Omnitrophota bacterium]
MKICVIIPAYNESKTIASLIQGIKQLNLDILIIDDGSIDNTAKIAQNNNAVVLVNPENKGKGISLCAGFNYALSKGFDAVISMDADGQHDPNDISYFTRLAKYSTSSIFIGNRMSKPKNMPKIRFITNKFMSWLISLIAKQNIPDSQCGFRLIKKEVLEKIKFDTAKFETESELLIKASRLGFKIESIPVNTIYRGEKSKINPILDTIRFIKFISKNIFK